MHGGTIVGWLIGTYVSLSVLVIGMLTARVWRDLFLESLGDAFAMAF